MRISDWSSDVCCSDLHAHLQRDAAGAQRLHRFAHGVVAGGFSVEDEEPVRSGHRKKVSAGGAGTLPAPHRRRVNRRERGGEHAHALALLVSAAPGALARAAGGQRTEYTAARKPDGKSDGYGKEGEVGVNIGVRRLLKKKKIN